MAHIRIAAKQARKSRGEELFNRAANYEEKGDLRSAFRLYLAGAKCGDSGCQLNIGNLYDAGTGVRRNRETALRWYKRAYRAGSASAANNIRAMWRNEKKSKRALGWFRKAVRLGDDEANLEIAEHYLHNERNPAKAISHFESVCKSSRVTQAGAERAARMLKTISKQSTSERRCCSDGIRLGQVSFRIREYKKRNLRYVSTLTLAHVLHRGPRHCDCSTYIN